MNHGECLKISQQCTEGVHSCVFHLWMPFSCYFFLLVPLPPFPQGWQSRRDSVFLSLHYSPTILNICNPASTIFAKMDFSELSPELSTALFSVGISPVERWPVVQSCAAGMLINTGFQASNDTFVSLWLIAPPTPVFFLFFLPVKCVWLLYMKMFQKYLPNSFPLIFEAHRYYVLNKF